MSGVEVVGACDTVKPPCHGPRHGLEGILGETAWQRLPRAVRARFGEPAIAVDYVGEFEIVRASLLGRVLAWLCQLIGTPVVPRTGRNVPAIVRVGPTGEGVAWNREYQWPDSTRCLVRSTKVIGPDGALVEKLPARLCMPLDVFEREGALHFVSRGYYFELGTPGMGRPIMGQPIMGQPIRIPLPAWLSPGITHVEHRDESGGWFRFTMAVRHRFFGELFYQTGRFRAAGG